MSTGRYLSSDENAARARALRAALRNRDYSTVAQADLDAVDTAERLWIENEARQAAARAATDASEPVHLAEVVDLHPRAANGE